MTQLLGVDVSSWQPPDLPWQTWRRFGVEFAYIRAGLGYVSDHGAEMHRRQARAAGMLTGAYWAVLAHDSETTYFDPVRSARNFDRVIQPGDELPPMVDVEALGVNATMLGSFMREFDRLRPGSGVGIYTSAYFWHLLIGHDHYEFAKYPLWVAMYGINGLQDPPSLPDIWRGPGYVCWQWRYKKGYLPGFDRDLDINLWSGAKPMPATNDQLRGLIAEADKVQDDADVAIAAAQAIKTQAAAMVVQLNGLMNTPPPPPPPPPPTVHTMANKTNQAVINLFNTLFRGTAKLESVLTVTQRATLYGARLALYTGPAVEAMALTDAEKARVIAAL